MKAPVCPFNQKKALVGAFSVKNFAKVRCLLCAPHSQVSAVISPGSRKLETGHHQTHAGSNSINSRSAALQLAPTIANIRWVEIVDATLSLLIKIFIIHILMYYVIMYSVESILDVILHNIYVIDICILCRIVDMLICSSQSIHRELFQRTVNASAV